MRRQSLILVFISMAVLPGESTFAKDSTWLVRAIPSYFVTASSDSPVITTQPAPLGIESNSHSVDGDAGIGIGFEYLWGGRIGFEGAAFLSSHDTKMIIANDLGTFSASDSTRFRTFTFGVNYYFDTENSVQWSVGGFVPLMFADGTDHVFPDLNRTESRAYDQDYGIGVKGAAEWSFAPNSPWTLSVEGRYMFLLTMESETIGDIDVDPFVLSLGLAYRF